MHMHEQIQDRLVPAALLIDQLSFLIDQCRVCKDVDLDLDPNIFILRFTGHFKIK